MNFRTTIKLQPENNSIDYKSSLLLLGSCFSENMEDKLDFFKFDQYTNPFGIVFQPKAIEKALFDCVEKKAYVKEDLIQHGDIWLSLHHHSKFNNRDHKLVLNEPYQCISNGPMETATGSILINGYLACKKNFLSGI